MTKIKHFLPAFEKGHFYGLVDEGKDLRQSLLYKQILPRPVHRSGSFVALAKKDSEGGTQSRQKTSIISVSKNLRNRLLKICAICGKNQRNLLLTNDLRLCDTLYYCRETFTDVMRALQIHLFLTNKANFLDDQMNVSSFKTTNYEQRTMNYEVKNKANTKPIQTRYKANTKPIQTQYKPNSNPIYPVVASGEAGTNPKWP